MTTDHIVTKKVIEEGTERSFSLAARGGGDGSSLLVGEERLNVPAPDDDPEDDPPLPFMEAVFPMILSAGMDYFGLGLIMPLLPFVVVRLGGNDESPGLVLFAQYLGVTVGSITFGRVADVISRKVAIQIACAGDVVFFLLTGFAPTIQMLIACRVLAGLFTPLVPSISWIIDSGKGRSDVIAKNMGVWSFTMSLSLMCGSIVGGLLGADNWILANGICAVLAFLALVVVSLATAPPRADATAAPEGLDVVTRQSEFHALMMLNLVLGLAMTGSIVASALILAYQLGASPVEIALFFTSVAVVHSVINLTLLPQSMKRYESVIPALLAVLAVSLISMTLLCFDFAYDSVLLTCILANLSTCLIPTGMTSANILAGMYADKYSTNAKSQVLGISRLAFNIGQVCGPLFATFTITYGHANVAYFAGSICLDICAVAVWMYWHMVKGKVEYVKAEPKVKDKEKSDAQTQQVVSGGTIETNII
jgi:DHA1 family multidrug resistance protein-like MFS transporter